MRRRSFLAVDCRHDGRGPRRPHRPAMAFLASGDGIEGTSIPPECCCSALDRDRKNWMRGKPTGVSSPPPWSQTVCLLPSRENDEILRLSPQPSGPGSSGPDSMPLQVHPRKTGVHCQVTQRVRLQQIDLRANKDSVVVDTFRTPGKYEVNMREAGEQGKDMFYRYTIDSSHFYVETGSQKRRNTVSISLNTESRRAIVNKAMDRLLMIERKPIEERIRAAHSGLRSCGRHSAMQESPWRSRRGIARKGTPRCALSPRQGRRSDSGGRMSVRHSFPETPSRRGTVWWWISPIEESFLLARWARSSGHRRSSW